METRKLLKELNEIEMSEEMRKRIIRNCYREVEGNKMSKNATKRFVKRPMVAVASLTLCLCLTGVTSLAATGRLKGFFKDIIRWDGAVTGTSYEQATEEVELNVATVSEVLTVQITMLYPQNPPYSVFETFGIESYRIVDAEGNIVVEDKNSEMIEVLDGKIHVNIPLDNLTSGNYKLIVDKLIGSAKADQPLVMSGTWECEFEKD